MLLPYPKGLCRQYRKTFYAATLTEGDTDYLFKKNQNQNQTKHPRNRKLQFGKASKVYLWFHFLMYLNVSSMGNAWEIPSLAFPDLSC